MRKSALHCVTSCPLSSCPPTQSSHGFYRPHEAFMILCTLSFPCGGKTVHLDAEQPNRLIFIVSGWRALMVGFSSNLHSISPFEDAGFLLSQLSSYYSDVTASCHDNMSDKWPLFLPDDNTVLRSLLGLIEHSIELNQYFVSNSIQEFTEKKIKSTSLIQQMTDFRYFSQNALTC